MESLAQLFLLILFAALVVNLVKNGREGALAWMRAKFLGHEATA